MAALLYTLPGLIVVLSIWDVIPEKGKNYIFLLLYDLLVVVISILIYVILGIIYEKRYPELIYTHESPLRVSYYALGVSPLLVISSLIGVGILMGVENLILRFYRFRLK